MSRASCGSPSRSKAWRVSLPQTAQSRGAVKRPVLDPVWTHCVEIGVEQLRVYPQGHLWVFVAQHPADLQQRGGRVRGFPRRLPERVARSTGPTSCIAHERRPYRRAPTSVDGRLKKLP
jgi:hypothetical protein